MKRLLIQIAAVLCVAASVAAQEVTSKNAVGFIRQSAPAKKYALLGWQFEKVGSSNATVSVTELLGTTGFSEGDTVTAFDYSQGIYVSEDYYDGIGWVCGLPGTNVTILRGDGIWFYGQNAVTLTTAGEVPSASYASNTVTLLGPGNQLLCYPYPVARLLSATSLDDVAAEGDTVTLFDGTNYLSSDYYTGLGFVPDRTLQEGAGFWYFKSTPGMTNWTEVKPYLWP